MTGQQITEAQARRVDSLFSYLNDSASPGLAISVIKDGRVVLSRGYGLADIEHKVPITPSTVFDAASLAKQFTGLAVAMLASDGRIQLTDDIRKYIPELPDFGKPVTIDELLHHSSGIRDWVGGLSVGGWRPDDPVSFRQIMTFAYNQRALNFDPGTEYRYSNTGYNILAELVQRVTGQPLAAWAAEHFFRPLAMNNTHIRESYSELIPSRAFGYEQGASGLRVVPNLLTGVGSSSLFTTVEDFSRWMINFDAAAVGGTKAMSIMRTPEQLKSGAINRYGFGITTGNDPFRKIPFFTSSGAWAGFNTFDAYYPDLKFGIVVFSNSNIPSLSAQNAVIRIAEIFLPVEKSNSLAAQQKPAPTPSIQPASVNLDDYTGLYQLSNRSHLRIVRIGDILVSQFSHAGRSAMDPKGRDVFVVSGEDSEDDVAFVRGAAGKVTGLTYRHLAARKLDETQSTAPKDLTAYTGYYDSDELGTSYHVVVQNGTLQMQHRHRGTIPLKWLWSDEFNSPDSYFSSVDFERDAAGQVTGLLVNGDRRSTNLRFLKRR